MFHPECLEVVQYSTDQCKTPDDGQKRCPKHVEFCDRINLDN